MTVSKSAQIHPTAVIEDGATIGAEVRVGPFCHIGARTTIGDGSEVKSHVVIEGRTTIGSHARIFPQVALGCEPQNINYKGEDTELVIGDHCVIREGVTMHPGMPAHGGRTSIGDHCLFLAYSHVAHDCHVGDHVILSNNVMLAGHVTIGDRVIMGGGAAVHQFTRIGHHAFIGGLSAVSNDVIPYGMLNGNPGVLAGLNIIGMQRAGMDRPQIHAVRAAYKLIFDGRAPIRARVAELRAKGIANDAVRDIVEFIEADSERALSSPARGTRG